MKDRHCRIGFERTAWVSAIYFYQMQKFSWWCGFVFISVCVAKYRRGCDEQQFLVAVQRCKMKISRCQIGRVRRALSFSSTFLKLSIFFIHSTYVASSFRGYKTSIKSKKIRCLFLYGIWSRKYGIQLLFGAERVRWNDGSC